MAITTYPLNGITYHAEDAEKYLCTRTSGVFAADNFGIEITDDMEVSIGAGQAWIKNNTFSGKSITSTETEVITIPIADATLPRIDRIVIEFTTAVNGSEIKLIQGTPAVNPAAPAIVQTETKYQLGLYTIRVNAAVTEMQSRYITDTRLDESVCGLMRDAVTRIPTTELRERFIDDVQNIVDNIRDILDEETAGHLLNLINMKAETVTYTAEVTTSGWQSTNGAAPYYKTVGVSGITEDDDPIVGLIPPQTYSDVAAAQAAFNEIYSITTATNSITLYSNVIPPTAVTIQIKAVR